MKMVLAGIVTAIWALVLVNFMYEAQNKCELKYSHDECIVLLN